MDITYEIAENRDINVIFTQAKALIDTYEDTAEIDYEKVLNWMNAKITKDIGEYTKVLRGGTVVGYYCLRADGELDDLYILPPYQGQGIGSCILERCIASSKKDLYLYVFTRNTRAIALYERFGFSCTEKVGKTRQIMARNG